MIKRIDTLSYTNAFRSVSPGWKCGFAVLLFALSSLAHPPVQLLIALWLLVWVVRYAGISLRHYLLLVGAAGLFFILSLPALLLEFGPVGSATPRLFDAELFGGYEMFVPSAALERAGTILTRVLACLSTMLFLILTTPLPELLQVLKRLRMPQLVLELMLITYRFLFLLADIAEDMTTAQRARGGYAGAGGALRDTARLVVRLFQKAMQQSAKLSHGLVARGFADEIPFAPPRAQPVPRRYLAESAGGLLVLAGLEFLIRWRDLL
ncbi:cobalt/nickel transport system permease protein [Tumebacillus sp. BK434]|uniref:cobalt ECF transporter T component CbiQ n=1 Tax=Tumebacillus sp. BK434 TaxID=2512169 RepID=UPI0010519915|nr:cobalt ECF transporter T component CbiQ [Tumebacillus sp. BK434]TCP52621.1 cobalt/nickel transport system permease protein [Tumebacillus sp. BK434]